MRDNFHSTEPTLQFASKTYSGIPLNDKKALNFPTTSKSDFSTTKLLLFVADIYFLGWLADSEAQFRGFCAFNY